MIETSPSNVAFHFYSIWSLQTRDLQGIIGRDANVAFFHFLKVISNLGVRAL